MPQKKGKHRHFWTVTTGLKCQWETKQLYECIGSNSLILPATLLSGILFPMVAVFHFFFTLLFFVSFSFFCNMISREKKRGMWSIKSISGIKICSLQQGCHPKNPWKSRKSRLNFTAIPGNLAKTNISATKNQRKGDKSPKVATIYYPVVVGKRWKSTRFSTSRNKYLKLIFNIENDWLKNGSFLRWGSKFWFA